MDRDNECFRDGAQFGYDAADHLAKLAGEYCAHQQEFLRLGNEPRINALRFEARVLTERRRDLVDLLRRTPRPGDRSHRILRAIVFAAIGAVLMVVAYFFALLSFEPFRLGSSAKLVCLGVALIVAYAVHEFLDTLRKEGLRKCIVSLVFLCAISGSALLAGVRADILARQIQGTAPSVVIDGDNAAQPAPEETFYKDQNTPMRWLMIFLALAIDLGAGLAIHRAIDLIDDSGQDYRQISRELGDVDSRLGEIVDETTSLLNGPPQFAEGFRRDFYGALLTQSTKHAISKVLIISLCAVLFPAGKAFGQQKLDLVIAVDLTASVTVKGHDGISQFDRYRKAIGDLLSEIPGGSKVTIVGITENSFGQPYILLRAVTVDDPGYFGERLASSRGQLGNAWRQRSAQIKPNARKSDILGAAMLAGELFRESHSATRALIFFSDMRNTTDGLNFETVAFSDAHDALRKAERQGLVPDLRGVDVHVLGADAGEGGMQHWIRVKEFWTSYFSKAGSNVLNYSSVIETLDLKPYVQ